jgi:hypothetical protein
MSQIVSHTPFRCFHSFYNQLSAASALLAVCMNWKRSAVVFDVCTKGIYAKDLHANDKILLKLSPKFMKVSWK